METGNSYSTDTDYLAHGFDLAHAGEYQQEQLAPPPYSQCNQANDGSLCNGTPCSMRKDPQGSDFPKNHNTIERSQDDRTGWWKKVQTVTQKFHRNINLINHFINLTE